MSKVRKVFYRIYHQEYEIIIQRYEAEIQESNQLKNNLLEAEGLIVVHKNNIQEMRERTIFVFWQLGLEDKKNAYLELEFSKNTAIEALESQLIKSSRGIK